MKKLIFAVLVLLTMTSMAQINAPIGLGWQTDKSTVQSKLVSLGGKYYDGELKTENCSWISYTEVDEYELVMCFFYKENLVKVAMMTTSYTSWGFTVSQYNKMYNLLTEKYGEAALDVNKFEEPYYEGDGYEMSAIGLGKAEISAYWNDSANTFLCLEIKGNGAHCYLSFIYEHDSFSNYSDEMKALKMKKL